MTPEEYAEIRDIFLEALEALDDAMSVFYDLALDHNVKVDEDEDDWEIGDAMRKHGLWISTELGRLSEAQAVLYSLVGKAEQRSRPFSER